LDRMSKFSQKTNEWMQENASGILGTVAFHLLLAVVFLIFRISAERTLLESMIMFEFEEETEEIDPEEEAPDTEFERLVASYLEESRSNIPVNVARQLDEDLSTEKYVDEVEQELDADRSDEYRDMQERLRELEEIAEEDLIMDSDEDDLLEKPPAFEGATNIFYDLEFRYHTRLPVPVYQCEGNGIIEVKIAVDQQGRVVQAEVEKPGNNFNEICLAEAARRAAMRTRFNGDFGAPVRQAGTITYHFIAQ
jgi:hypothetical protein